MNAVIQLKVINRLHSHHLISRRFISVLVLNCGSSSLKFQILHTTHGQVKLRGQADNLNTSQGKLKWSLASNETPGSNKNEMVKQEKLLDSPQFDSVLDQVFDIVETVPFTHIGHRVVHGGEEYTKPTKLTKEVVDDLAGVSRLAPLHNPVQLRAIKRALARFSWAGQAAVFDTAYYANMPQHAYLYPVPYKWYTEHGVRKYGFHGTSHYYLSEQAAKYLGRPVESVNIVSCHLGAGCSVTASKGGVGVDTSMGFSPLSGVMMGTRSGDIDPTVLSHIVEESGRSWAEVLSDLNRESGLKGITGTPDSLCVEQLYEQNDEKGMLGVEMFCYAIAKYIAAYIVPLGRIDALVFSGGIGEKSSIKREKIIAYLSGLGFSCNPSHNDSHGVGSGGLVSVEGRGAPVLVLPTNEELVIAKLTQTLYAK